MANARVEIRGAKELERALQNLDKKVQKQIARKAVNAGLTPIQETMKANAKEHQDTGALAKSIGRKVRQQKGLTEGRVGPRSDFVLDTTEGKAYRAKKAKEHLAGLSASEQRRRIKRPQKYSHLVEFGTEHSAAEPFIRPAMDSQAAAAVEAVARVAGEEIDKEAAK